MAKAKKQEESTSQPAGGAVSSDETESHSPRRPWWRLHFSTIIVLILATIAWALVALPSILCYSDFGSNRVEVRVYGWPAVHYIQSADEIGLDAPIELMLDLYGHPGCRELMLVDSSLGQGSFEYTGSDLDFGYCIVERLEERFWSRPENWFMFKDSNRSSVSRGRFLWPGALVNLATLLAALAGLAWVWEYLRRRRQTWYQVRLLEFALIVTLVCIGLGWYVREAQRARLINRAFQQSGGVVTEVRLESSLPAPLDRLTDYRLRPGNLGSFEVSYEGPLVNQQELVVPFGSRIRRVDIMPGRGEFPESVAEVKKLIDRFPLDNQVIFELHSIDPDVSTRCINALPVDKTGSLVLETPTMPVDSLYRFSKLQDLRMYKVHLKGMDARRMPSELKTLVLDKVDPSDPGLRKWLADLDQLVGLEVTDRLGSAGDSPKAIQFPWLPEVNAKLKMLSIGLRVDNELTVDLRDLSRLKSLTTLDVWWGDKDMYKGGGNISLLCNLKLILPDVDESNSLSLEEISLTGVIVDDELVDWLLALPQLRDLDFYECEISDLNKKRLRTKISGMRIYP